MTERPTDPETRTASFGAGETLAQPRTRTLDVGEKPGDTVGPFKLISVLGEGGFGVVWLAERREPIVQRVAVKVIKPGMDSREVVARFEQERQALAVMNHPSIAKVLDAGATATGRPYFVMEYVKGDPITAYCDKNRLTLKERLELFLPVLDAVQHAHSKGIIHRDLKPSNVLVAAPEGEAAVGLPKVIDFGIAKAISQVLTDKTLFTQQGQIVGTPEYMSPEQANLTGIDVDTRTDVYSLGVVLYELLTGVLPFDPRDLRSKGYDEIRRIIREVDPPNPSTRLGTMMTSGHEAEVRTFAEKRGIRVAELERALRSELEWIPLKAMRKERERRYSTPSEMAQDIRNYLGDRPLIAGPESRRYRARKFVRKYRRAVGLGASIAATLIGATFVSIRFAIAEQKARADLQKVSQATESVVQYFEQDLFSSSELETDGGEQKAKDLVKSALASLNNRFQDQPLIRERIRGALSSTLLSMGEVENAKTALESIDLNQLAAISPALQADILAKLTEVNYRMQSAESAAVEVKLARERFNSASNTLGPDDKSTLDSQNQLGGALKAAGELAEARSVYQDVLNRRRRLLGDHHIDVLITRHNLNLVSLLEARAKRKEDRDAAKPLFEAALTERQEITKSTRVALGKDHPQTLATIAEEYGLLSESGQFDKAAALYPELIERMREVLGFSHWRTIETTARYGAALKRTGRLADAIDTLMLGLEGTRSVRGPLFRDTLAITDFLVTCLEENQRFDTARSLLIRAYSDANAAGDKEAASDRAAKIGAFFERRADAAKAAEWKKIAESA